MQVSANIYHVHIYQRERVLNSNEEVWEKHYVFSTCLIVWDSIPAKTALK